MTVLLWLTLLAPSSTDPEWLQQLQRPSSYQLKIKGLKECTQNTIKVLGRFGYRVAGTSNAARGSRTISLEPISGEKLGEAVQLAMANDCTLDVTVSRI